MILKRYSAGGAPDYFKTVTVGQAGGGWRFRVTVTTSPLSGRYPVLAGISFHHLWDLESVAKTNISYTGKRCTRPLLTLGEDSQKGSRHKVGG